MELRKGSRSIENSLSPVDSDPEETARALVLMTERYLLDAFGNPSNRPSPEKISATVAALETVWLRTLYGAKDPPPGGTER